jgi:DNA/RNA endonuclease YhcR with UshA esterase domain
MTMQGQRVCVTGHISFFRGRPEMILSTPKQVVYFAPPSSLSDWSLADRGMERRFALRKPATGC